MGSGVGVMFWGGGLHGVDMGDSYLNPFWHTGRRALDAIATSDPSVTREVQRGGRHDVSGVQAVECDRTALS